MVSKIWVQCLQVAHIFGNLLTQTFFNHSIFFIVVYKDAEDPH